MRHVISELKEAWFCLRAGRVTRGYPFEPSPAPPGYRGCPVLDPDRCTGCGACANACPSRTILVTDESEYREIHYDLTRCIFCGRCEEVCPEDAVRLSGEFELATTNRDDLHIRARFLLKRCEDCGAVIGTRRSWTRLAEEVREEVGGLDPLMRLCPPCRRRRAHRDAALGRESDA